jgi:hypothetical protein
VWHPGAERLALSALPAEVRDPETDAHLAVYPPCRDEAEALGRAVATARAAGSGPGPTVPPVRVWRAIAVELGGELGSGGCPAVPDAADRGTAERRWHTPGRPAVAADGSARRGRTHRRPPHRVRVHRTSPGSCRGAGGAHSADDQWVGCVGKRGGRGRRGRAPGPGHGRRSRGRSPRGLSRGLADGCRRYSAARARCPDTVDGRSAPRDVRAACRSPSRPVRHRRRLGRATERRPVAFRCQPAARPD